MSACIYILLPVHNRCKITRKFIDSLVQQSYQNYHLLLIDDGSTDGTDEMVRGLIDLEKLTVLTGKGDWWWAGALQQGIRWLKKADIKATDVVLMINDDVIFKTGFLANGIDFLMGNPDSLLLSRLYDEEKDVVVESGVHADLKQMSFLIAEKAEDINCFSTRGLFMHWNTLQSIGGFHPVLLPHYGSDYEFTIRANKKGIALRTVENVYLTADNNTTGIHDAEKIQNLMGVFSKRYVMNPIYWTVFVILASPMRWMPCNLLRVWFRGILIIKKVIMQ